MGELKRLLFSGVIASCLLAGASALGGDGPASWVWPLLLGWIWLGIGSALLVNAQARANRRLGARVETRQVEQAVSDLAAHVEDQLAVMMADLRGEFRQLGVSPPPFARSRRLFMGSENVLIARTTWSAK